MKLQSIKVIFVLGLLESVEMVSSLCLIKTTTEPRMYWFQCSLSDNYLSDVEAAPVDVPRMSFYDSRIEVIRNRSFARLSSGLEILQIYFSQIGEIEDNAFEGLVKLRSLEIVGSNIRVVEGAWFKGLTSLKTVSFQRNEIKRIETSFFSILPPLNLLDVSENKLNCLPLDSFANFHTEEFRVASNPLSMVCLASLMDWFESENIRYDYNGRNNMDLPLEVLKGCAEKLPTPQLDEEFLKNCIQKTLMDLLSPQENYTIEQLCQFLKDKPSPFLNCSI